MMPTEELNPSPFLDQGVWRITGAKAAIIQWQDHKVDSSVCLTILNSTTIVLSVKGDSGILFTKTNGCTTKALC